MSTLTYPGDVSHMVGEVKGPTLLAPTDVLTAVEVTYDSANNTSRVTFAHGGRCSRCLGLVTPDNPGEPVKVAYAVRTNHRRACPA